MEETVPVVNAVFPRKVRPPLDIAVTTLMTMGVVFLISSFSIGTAVTVGSFAGFCVAAWNWLRMGQRRKALAHFIAAFGIYVLILVVSVLIAIGLALLFVRSVPTPTEWSEIPGVMPAGSAVVDVVQNPAVPPIGVLLFNLIAGALVVAYLYKATARDVQQIEQASDIVELYNFLPLLGVAAIGAAFIMFSTALFNQAHIANVQNHVYCELLQPGMTPGEVTEALSEIAPLRQAIFDDRADPAIEKMPDIVSSWVWINWEKSQPAAAYDLFGLFIGYDTNDRLVWLGRLWSDSKQTPRDGFDTIACPWTLYNSLTAR